MQCFGAILSDARAPVCKAPGIENRGLRQPPGRVIRASRLFNDALAGRRSVKEFAPAYPDRRKADRDVRSPARLELGRAHLWLEHAEYVYDVIAARIGSLGLYDIDIDADLAQSGRGVRRLQHVTTMTSAGIRSQDEEDPQRTQGDRTRLKLTLVRCPHR